MKKFVLALPLVILILASCGSKKQAEAKFESLFNGNNFDGWETYIGVPHLSVDVPGMAKDGEGKYTQPIGLNNDPLKVFSIVQMDGTPALRSSGQFFGSFATVKEYENYHLRLEVKWGDKKWAPREDLPRNAGVLYHGTGDFGKGLGVWKASHECQVMENMFGDSYCMGNTYCDITAKSDENGRYTFDPNAPKVSFGPGLEAGPICSKSLTNEKPTGEWNVVEVICFADTSVHVINGKVNMINTNLHLVVDGQNVPLTKGVIQLQSEGAEVFYRNIEIKPISRIPVEYLK